MVTDDGMIIKTLVECHYAFVLFKLPACVSI